MVKLHNEQMNQLENMKIVHEQNHKAVTITTREKHKRARTVHYKMTRRVFHNIFFLRRGHFLKKKCCAAGSTTKITIFLYIWCGKNGGA